MGRILIIVHAQCECLKSWSMPLALIYRLAWASRELMHTFVHLQLCSEPEALPFCALAYALMGIISTVLVALPPVARALLAITA